MDNRPEGIMADDCDTDGTAEYDVLILGGGVIGLSILRSATIKGWKCVLVESEPDLLAWASGSNSGIVCTGVDASPGTLERALIRDSISNIRGYCEQHNIPMRPSGSLVCQWPWDSQMNNSGDQGDNNHHSSLEDVLRESLDAGDTHATILSSQQVKNFEPNLSRECLGAVHIPGEIVVDPWLFSISYAVHARENGATIFTNWQFDTDLSSFDGETWTAVRVAGNASEKSSTMPTSLRTRAIVNASGLSSDVIQAKIHQKLSSTRKSSYISSPQWTSKPRRGQYRVFQTTANTTIMHPIQPIPTQRTKGIFVFSSLYGQLCVGPTAHDQDSKTDRTVDPVVSKDLLLIGQKIVPGLSVDSNLIGEYVGLRPGSDKRDYQIHISPDINWVAAAGIRSTGLTASLGIGRHVVHLLASILPEPESPPRVQTTPLPPLGVLIREYHDRGDQSVRLQDGYTYKVTHPLTKFGWDSITDMAQIQKLLPSLARYGSTRKLPEESTPTASGSSGDPKDDERPNDSSIMLQPAPGIEVLPFAVAVPASTTMETLVFEDDYYNGDDNAIDDELAETKTKHPVPVTRPLLANSSVMDGMGIVGTIIVLKTSYIVWFGWGKTTSSSTDSTAAAPRVGVNNSRIIGSNAGSKSCAMGQLLIAMPPRKFGGGSPAESSTSKLIGNEHDDNTIARQMASRLSQKCRKPVLVTCQLDPNMIQVMGLDPDLLHAKAAALAEKRVWDLLRYRET